MFRVTRYPMISQTESGRVGYRKEYRVAGRVRVTDVGVDQTNPDNLFDKKKTLRI